jgi:hypothetical protein
MKEVLKVHTALTLSPEAGAEGKSPGLLVWFSGFLSASISHLLLG